MKNKDKLIEIFNKLYIIHSVLDNKYEAQSYKKIVNSLSNYKGEIKSIDDLKGISGIGDRTLLKVDEILRTGKLKLLDDMMRNKNIMSRFELQKVLGIGPKLSKKLVEEKGIKSIEELRKAYKSGDIKLSHMQEIGLKYYDKLNSEIPRKEITDYKNKFEKVLHKKFPEVDVHMAGSYRRGKKLSGDIDMILVNPKIKTLNELNKSDIFDKIVEYLVDEGLIIEIINKSKNNLMAITNTYRHIDIKMSPQNLLPFYMLYFGSGVSFSKEIRQKAKEKGYKLSERGLYKNGKVVMDKAVSEKEIFNKLDIEYIKPENR